MSEEIKNQEIKNVLLQREADLQKELQKEEQRRLDLSIEQETYATKALNTAEQQININQKLLDLSEKSTDQLNQELVLLREKQERLNKNANATKEEKEALREEIIFTEQLRDLGDDVRKSSSEQYIQNIKNNEALKKRIQISEGVASSLANILQMSENWKTNTIAQLGFLTKAGGIGDMMQSLSQQLSLTNFAGNMATKGLEATVTATVALAREQDNAISQFRKVTGAGAEYNDVMTDSFINTRTFGVSQAEAAQSTQELFVNMSGFSGMNEAVRTQLTETTALMSEMGISASTTAKNLEIMTKSLGMSGTQADDTAKDLFSLAQSLNLPPQIIMQDFGPAMSTLAAHGDDAVRVFSGMAAASKATGIAINDLLGIVSKFDQFESGAQAVGKLNAMLGGPYLNTVEMLRMSEEERIMAIMRSMEASGKQFSEMSKFEKIAFANAAGINDMAKANALFGQSTEAYQMQLDRAKESTAQQERLNEVVREAQPIFDKFRLIITNLAVSMRPVIEFLGDVADGILFLQEKMGNFGGIVTTVAAGITLFVLGLKAASAVAVPAGASIGAGLSAMGTAALVGAKGLGILTLVAIGLGVAMMAVGAGIKLAASGLAEMGTAFKDFSTEQMVAFTGLLFTSATLGLSATMGMTAFAASLAYVAGAMKMIDGDKIKNMSDLVHNINDLSKIEEDKAAVAKTLIESVGNLNVTTASTATPAAETLKRINELLQNLPNAGGASSPFYSPRAVDITLMLDGDVLLNKLGVKIDKEFGS